MMCTVRPCPCAGLGRAYPCGCVGRKSGQHICKKCKAVLWINPAGCRTVLENLAAKPLVPPARDCDKCGGTGKLT